jgi:LysM repeat protein
VADDPGSDAAPRPRRRRRYDLEAGLETPSTGQTDDPASPEPASPGSREDTPFPTFLHAAPGNEPVRERDAEGQWIIESAAPSAASSARPPAGAARGSLMVLDDRSADPDICPFLRAVDDSDRLVAAVEAPDPANRCAALRDAVPQSLRQQELVCLAAGHVSCPRYLRGALVMAEAPEPVVRSRATLTPAVLGSLVVLVIAASASLAFVMARGGLELVAAVPTASPAASSTAVAVASFAATPTPVLTPAPTASPTPSPSPTPTPTPSATATPTASPTAKATPKPAATSDRYAVLRPCPDAPSCWIYRVRAGDNLYSIAHWFGISLDSIYARNPWTRTQGLRAGQDLRLPPPTR